MRERPMDRFYQAPFEVWLAIPHKMPAPKLSQPQLRIVRMSGPSLTEGIVTVRVDGIPVNVFNASKTSLIDMTT